MAIVLVFPFMTVVMARNSVVKDRTSPISIIMAPIIKLDKSFMLADICVIHEKHKEAKTMKKASVFLLFKVLFRKSSVKEPSSFSSAGLFRGLEEVCTLSFRSASTGFFIRRKA